MSNAKISALTSATTPLAGTEVLPVVQSGVTKQVSAANLTAGRNIATSAITSTVNTANGAGYQITNSNNSAYVTIQVNGATGSGVTNWANSTVIESVPASTGGLTFGAYTGDINFQTNYRTITPLTLKQTGDVNVNAGNLVQGTAAKGINFTANTPAAGMTSQLLNWYEEGTWTTTVSAASNITGTPTLANGRYVRVGKQIFIQGRFSVNVTLSAVDVTFAFTHPFTKATTDWSTGLVVNDSTYALGAINNSGASAGTFYFLVKSTAATSGTANYQFSITYLAA